MHKKRIAVFAGIGLLLIGIAAFIIIRRPMDETANELAGSSDTSIAAAISSTYDGTSDNSADAANDQSIVNEEVKIVESEEVAVINNSLEYSIKALLCKDSKSEKFIRLEYYLDGESVIQELGLQQIPELKDVNLKGENEALNSKANRIKAVYLNPKYSKAFLLIEGNSLQNYTDTSLYSFKLDDSTFKKLFADNGDFTDLYFTKDYKYAGFSYYDSLASSIYQESSLLEILNCEDDNFTINGSRDSKGVIIGNNDNPEYIFDYKFLSWNSNSVAKLNESVTPKNAESLKDGSIKSRDVLYDVSRNVLMNLDGSAVSNNESPVGQGEQPQKEIESTSIKTLRSFYSCLQSENEYSKAMDMLNKDFKIRLKMLEQFGISELEKSDIDVDSASIYSNILGMTRLESVVMETAAENISTIYFYQSFSLSDGEQSSQPLVAHLKKMDKTWEIVLIEDGKPDEKPFKP